jgi:hypothetical protein
LGGAVRVSAVSEARSLIELKTRNTTNVTTATILAPPSAPYQVASGFLGKNGGRSVDN